MELERSNNDLEQFAHTVSHDLQEPLRMVSSFTDLLLKKHSDKLNEEAKSYINFAIDGAKRMQSQIQGLLTYSRVSTRSNPFDRISLNEVLKEALMNLSVTVKESGARIESEDLPVVFGDRYQLVSVFQNLIGNAIKFGKAGVIPEINIFTRDTGASDDIEISVSDNGIGILEKDIDKIFLIFHRLHSQDKYPGTGIGLAVVKKIIEKHGGEIHVDSVMNKGSKFVFSLKKGQI
jgi:light-regulated signal transduction histidine kinase (bacteriophytochrome)